MSQQNKQESKQNFPVSAILSLFIIWRIFLILLAIVSPVVIPVWGGRFPYVEERLIATKLPSFIWSWGNFDSVHYLPIAQNYYSDYFTQTFFPFYPILIRLAAKLFFENNYFLSGIFISNISFCFALILFYKLMKLEKMEKYFLWSMIFLFTYTTSFYFGALYSESLFLVLSLSSFYAARRGNWLLAGIAGFFASLTRLFGLFIFPALIYEIFVQFRQSAKDSSKLYNAAYLMLIPLGLVAYMVYLQVEFKDALLFWHAQPAFGAERVTNSIVLTPQVIYRYIKILFSVSAVTIPFWIALLELMSFLISAAILFTGRKTIRTSYSIYAWLILIVPGLTGTFSSLPRYTSIIFPLFMILAQIKNKPLKVLLAIFFLVIQSLCILLFTRGYWVS